MVTTHLVLLSFFDGASASVGSSAGTSFEGFVSVPPLLFFDGFTSSSTPTPTPTPTGQSQAEGGGIPRRRRRYIFPDGTQVLATTDEALGLLERFARIRTQQEKGRPRFERIPAAELESVVGWKQASDTAEELIRPVLPSNVVFTPEKKQFAQEIARLKRKIDDEEAIFALMM